MGINSARLEELKTRIQRDIDEDVLPSAQAAIGIDGEVVWNETFGDATPDERFLIFSCSKAFVAGVIWQLIDEGKLDVSEPVSTYFPEFAQTGKEGVTVEHLLTHTGGFPNAPMSIKHWTTREGRQKRMSTWRTNFEPGTHFEYHPTAGHWVLGEIIHAIDGRTASDAIAARITGPLGLKAMTLGAHLEAQGDIKDLETSGAFPSPDELEAVFGVRELDLGEVTPEVLLEFNKPEVRSSAMPGGGGISNAHDIAKYYQSLLHNSEQLWSPEVLHRGTAEVLVTLPDPMLNVPSSRTLGIISAGDDGLSAFRGMGANVSPRAFGHNGAGGQIAFADPESGISFSYLTNGIDMNFIRQAKRVLSIASKAGIVTQPSD